MKKLTLRAQLNGHLYQAERTIVNAVIRRVADPGDRDTIRLILLTHACYRGKVKIKTEDHYLRFLADGLLPYVEMSIQKSKDTNYNLAMPADLPIANDHD